MVDWGLGYATCVVLGVSGWGVRGLRCVFGGLATIICAGVRSRGVWSTPVARC